MRWPWLVLTVLAAACGGGAARPAAPAPPFEGFGSVSATVTLPDGTRREWCLLLADTEPRRERGLMEVTSLGGYGGMAFRFGRPVKVSFYMYRTALPLSIVFLAADGSVVSTADMDPCPATDAGACPLTGAPGPYTDAIEVPRGELERLGTVPGSRTSFGSAGCRPA